MHNYLIKVYITTVCLCYLHCYMFRHFRVTIRQFTTNASISYKHFSNFQLLKIQFINLTFMGLCIVRIFQYISNKMQSYTVYLYLETVLHVSGVTFTHHQEHIQLYLQHLLFVRPLLLPAAIAVGSHNGLTNTRCCKYSCLLS